MPERERISLNEGIIKKGIMKMRISLTTVAGLLAMALFAGAGANRLAAQSTVDPAHAAHLASGAMASDPGSGDPALARQIAELEVKVAQLQAALPNGGSAAAPAAGGTDTTRMPSMASAALPPMGPEMSAINSAPSMPGMTPGSASAPPISGVNRTAASTGSPVKMMEMMDKMMGMMDKMMPTGGGGAAMPAPAAMGMDRMKMEGGGSMPSAPAGGMSGMGMGREKTEMAAMMGKNMSGATSQSALPGFPGASHLYHIGATDFFLDHPQHIALTTEQQVGLNQAKEQAVLAKTTADRAIGQAEQELWTLTAADQPDAAKIRAKLGEIGKLNADERLAFIRAVGDASRLLTDEQRKSLTGFAPPAPAAAMPTAALQAGAMPATPMKEM